MVEPLRHRQTKGAATAMFYLMPPRHISTLPTAREAMMLNYKVFFVSDANATHTDIEHNNTLTAMANTFADVVTTAEMTALL
jgi:isochorismate hydrolase